MLRAAVLHPFLRGIRRFSTSSHPEALGACYVASWQLPRPDLHRSANDDFSGHTMPSLGRGSTWYGHRLKRTIDVSPAGVRADLFMGTTA
jgi:hypothetical protein